MIRGVQDRIRHKRVWTVLMDVPESCKDWLARSINEDTFFTGAAVGGAPVEMAVTASVEPIRNVCRG
jgi:hypothetical protein